MNLPSSLPAPMPGAPNSEASTPGGTAPAEGGGFDALILALAGLVAPVAATPPPTTAKAPVTPLPVPESDTDELPDTAYLYVPPQAPPLPAPLPVPAPAVTGSPVRPAIPGAPGPLNGQLGNETAPEPSAPMPSSAKTAPGAAELPAENSLPTGAPLNEAQDAAPRKLSPNLLEAREIKVPEPILETDLPAGTPIATTITNMSARPIPTSKQLPAAAQRREVEAPSALEPTARVSTMGSDDVASLLPGTPNREVRIQSTEAAPAAQPVSRAAEVIADTAIRMQREGSQRVEMTVELGEGKSISITLDRRGEAIRPTFHADAPEIRHALEQGWSRVSDRLADQGIRIERPSFDSSPNREEYSDRSRQQQGHEFRDDSQPRQRPRSQSPQPLRIPTPTAPARSGLFAWA